MWFGAEEPAWAAMGAGDQGSGATVCGDPGEADCSGWGRIRLWGDRSLTGVGRFNCWLRWLCGRICRKACRREQVRCALTAVIRKTLDAPGTFDDMGWLADWAFGASAFAWGDLYLDRELVSLLGGFFCLWGCRLRMCSGVGGAERWTSQKVWAGVDIPVDHALDG